ncbi:membrane protein [Streptomyces natalensis ATCC 27448]|uniref:Membrane protein n=1 Tax=Streptomyces natalensis ATCC 27448 TaxID=1240678 RepID=A0A0D7CPH2_9ACTN|nr:membrane protein [Streptomyces natalensis ATCC 27448]
MPLAATVLTGTVALYIALVAFGNITDYGTNRAFVQHVLAMDTTFRDPDLMWRSITSPVLQDAAYLAIIAWETAAAAVLVVATWLLASALRSGRGQAGRGRSMATVGLLMVLVLFGAGFIAIGGEWFAMWQSKSWNGLEAALRNFLLAGVGLVVLHLPREVD